MLLCFRHQQGHPGCDVDLDGTSLIRTFYTQASGVLGEAGYLCVLRALLKWAEDQVVVLSGAAGLPHFRGLVLIEVLQRENVPHPISACYPPRISRSRLPIRKSRSALFFVSVMAVA